MLALREIPNITYGLSPLQGRSPGHDRRPSLPRDTEPPSLAPFALVGLARGPAGQPLPACLAAHRPPGGRQAAAGGGPGPVAALSPDGCPGLCLWPVSGLPPAGRRHPSRPGPGGTRRGDQVRGDPGRRHPRPGGDGGPDRSPRRLEADPHRPGPPHERLRRQRPAQDPGGAGPQHPHVPGQRAAQPPNRHHSQPLPGPAPGPARRGRGPGLAHPPGSGSERRHPAAPGPWRPPARPGTGGPGAAGRARQAVRGLRRRGPGPARSPGRGRRLERGGPRPPAGLAEWLAQ